MSNAKSVRLRILRALLYLLTAPGFLGWLFPILAMATYAAKSPRMLPGLVLAAEWRPWAAKLWKWSTTFGRGVVLHPERSEATIRHELVHVAQFEDRILLAFFVALVLATVLPVSWALGAWISGLAWMAPNFLSAVLRGGHVYYDAEHEEAAYARTLRIIPDDVGKTFDEVLDAREKKL